MRTRHTISLRQGFLTPTMEKKGGGTEADTQRTRFPNRPLKYKVGKFIKTLSGKQHHDFNFPLRINEYDVDKHGGLRDEG